MIAFGKLYDGKQFLTLKLRRFFFNWLHSTWNSTSFIPRLKRVKVWSGSSRSSNQRSR